MRDLAGAAADQAHGRVDTQARRLDLRLRAGEELEAGGGVAQALLGLVAGGVVESGPDGGGEELHGAPVGGPEDARPGAGDGQRERALLTGVERDDHQRACLPGVDLGGIGAGVRGDVGDDEDLAGMGE